MKAAHHSGSFHVRSRKIREAANANPLTKCWRCGLTLNEHPNHHNGKPPRWTAGHTVDGDPDALLLPEASTCNYQAGAKLAHGQHTQSPSRPW